MGEVKWIKITTNMFDDEKIKIIESMPDADSILIIWIKLLTLAGRVNANGYIFLTENIPYTDEMLATVFNRPLNTIRLALETFKRFGMIDYDDNNVLHITNWAKHQNTDKLDTIREQNRIRQARYREKQKLITEHANQSKESNVTVTLHNALEKEKDIDIDQEKEVVSKDTTKDVVAPIQAKDLIANLVEYYQEATGSTDRKDYPFIGGLYNRYGYDAVWAAIDDLKIRLSVQPINNTQSYLVGILKSQSQDNQWHKANNAKQQKPETTYPYRYVDTGGG